MNTDEPTAGDGESEMNGFRFLFNRAIGPIEGDQRITTDLGVLVVREALHRLGIDTMIDELKDRRDPAHIRYSLFELILFRVCLLVQGYSSQDDADKLAHDPAFRIAVWDRSGDAGLDERLASQPTLSRLIDILATEPNFQQLIRIAAAPVLQRFRMDIGEGTGHHATLDIDGLPVVACGKQEGAEYNGYHGQKEFYPFFCTMSLDGDFNTGAADGLVGAMLRPGNASAAEDAAAFIDEVGDRVKAHCPGLKIDYRLDAGLMDAGVINRIVERGETFAGRLKKNDVLKRMAGSRVNRKPGPVPDYTREYVYEIEKYGAQTWSRKHRLILVVIDEPPALDELDYGPDFFFLSTNHDKKTMPAKKVLEHYRRRGIFEDRIGEFNDVIGLHLPHREYRKNEVLFQLAVLAYNVLSVIRCELEPDVLELDLGRVQKRVMKAGARIVKGGHRILLRVADAALGWWKLLTARLADLQVDCLRRLHRGGFMPVPSHAHRTTPAPLQE